LRDAHLERRGCRAVQPAVLTAQLDGAAGPGAHELVGVWAKTGVEIAVGVGDGLGGRARDPHTQRHTWEFGGHEAEHGAAYRRADPFAFGGPSGWWIVQDPAAHHHSFGTAVPDVRLDPEVGGRP